MGWIFGAVGIGFIAFILWCLCAAANKELPPIDEDKWNEDKWNEDKWNEDKWNEDKEDDI